MENLLQLPSDNDPISVKKLGLYELDNVTPPAISGPFTYRREIAGNVLDIEYDMSRYQEPPIPPDVPEHEVKEGSEAWYDWREYHFYHAALLHERKRLDATAEYLDRIAHYVLENCVKPEDRYRIVTEEDWRSVYSAALVPQVTQELLEETLRSFKAEYGGKEIFAALATTEGGLGKYDAIRVWETKLMVAMNKTEAEYAMIPLQERARKICGVMMDKWIGHLDIERERAKAKKNAK